MNPKIKINSRIRQSYVEELVDEIQYTSYEDLSNKIVDKIVESIYKSRTDDFNRFIEQVMTSHTHIEFKVHQAINYFEDGIFESLLDVEKSVFNLKTGCYDLGIKKGYFASEKGKPKIFDINKVPLAFFDLDILVQKHNEDKPYSFRNLSSGEQQMINGLLTIIYHLFYIKSVHNTNSGKIKYHIVNITLDEIELYFHPEYQRIFIKELLNTISRFLNFKFNILIVTHSPFILSDIPSQNVLKLKNGEAEKGDEINSFGANIHDLLADEFFLECGCMGEFAKDKIEQMIKDLNQIIKSPLSKLSKDIKRKEFMKKIEKSYHYINKKEELKYFNVIKLIGEPILRMKLEQMYEMAFREELTRFNKLIDDDNEEIIKKQILELQLKLKQLNKEGNGKA
ncbi:MAG: ATP-binding protein [Myroides odoratus]|nr:ATP-binding protein [Myroides odoratus]